MVRALPSLFKIVTEGFGSRSELYYRGYFELQIGQDSVNASYFGMPTIVNRNPDEISLYVLFLEQYFCFGCVLGPEFSLAPAIVLIISSDTLLI